MRSGNPALNDKTFNDYVFTADSKSMTLQGTVNKSGLLICNFINDASKSGTQNDGGVWNIVYLTFYVGYCLFYCLQHKIEFVY